MTISVSANGRVNLIGEHTDYNGGWVLPTAIPQQTTVSLKLRTDKLVKCSTSIANTYSYNLGEEKKAELWIDYIQGATQILARDGFRLSGFEVDVQSTVPMGSGLSSSAALEVALLKALRTAFELKLDDLQIAQIGQRIENDFVGAKVGIMDQMACAFAHYGEALYLDTETLQYERIPLPLDKMDLVVINSGIAHRHSDGGYNQRRAECEAACSALKIPNLRAMQIADLPKLEILPETLLKRARHVITENQRVHDAVRAIKSQNLAQLGELFYASHASMRDDYTVSIPEVDLLVELCRAHHGVYGARLTGGGFGGSIVAITIKDLGKKIATAVRDDYHAKTGETASVLVPKL